MRLSMGLHEQVWSGMNWKLKRVRQCAKCPWKVSTDQHDIPDGYSEALHRSLMACHEHPPREEAHCVGWLMNQIGAGNNIPLRLQVRYCENIAAVVLDGPQHARFEETLPNETA